MKILISNDDGINAIGIKTLANGLFMAGHTVLVVAPSDNRSGFSHSLSIRKPMGLNHGAEEYHKGIETFALDGTPADCIKFGCYHFADFNPDIVITGINDGPNLAIDTMYSGTVGSAMEGANNGKKAIAVSLASHRNCIYFDTCVKVILEVLNKLYKREDKVVWNVNVPNIPFEEIKGYKYTRLGKICYNETYDRVDCENETYFLQGDMLKEQSDDIETDVGAVMCSYVSITPILVDRTAYSVLEEIK